MKVKNITQVCMLITVMMLFASPLYADYESSLIGYWKLDETTGNTAYDSTSNDFDGTFYGDPVGGVAGQHGTCFDFPSSGDYAYVNDNDTLDIGTSDFSLTTWLYADSLDSNGAGLVVKRNPGSSASLGYGLSIFNNGFWVMFNGEGGPERVYMTSNTTPSTGQWYHAAITADRSGDITFYVDGNFDKSADISSDTGSIANSEGLNIARHQNGPYYYFNGKLDDIAIWNRALDSYEVDSVYDVGVETFEDILIGMNTTFSLGYSTDEINQLCQLYADGEDGLNPEMIYVDGLWWKYLDTLPNEGAHAMGEAYVHDGRRYIKLGSGLAGNPIPEPASALFALAGLGFAIRRKRRRS